MGNGCEPPILLNWINFYMDSIVIPLTNEVFIHDKGKSLNGLDDVVM
jgi:hypothetical protein